jgi:hypothetical protein
MGEVNFNTLIDKDVAIQKTVDLNVNKAVESAVDIEGNLATAEASADAIDGGGNGDGNGGTPPQFFEFLIDDFDEDQGVLDLAGGGASEDTVAIPNPADTDIPDIAERRILVETLSPTSDSEASTVLNDGELTVNVGSSAFANALAQYTSSPGAFDPTPGVTTADILAAPITDNVLSVTVDSFDPGVTEDDQNATTRVNLLIEDDAGQQALASAVLTQAFVNPVTIPVFLASLIDETLAPPSGTEAVAGSGVIILGTEDDADEDGSSGINLDAVESITLFLEDRPEIQTGDLTSNSSGDPIASAEFFDFNATPDQVNGGTIEERASVSATDLELDLLEINTFVPGQPGDGGNLAETDTFAQVSAEGAFSFSEALAASNGSGGGDDIL